MLKTLTAATALLAIASTAQAQTYTTLPLGNGWSTTTGPGGTYTTVPLGQGWSQTTSPNGYHALTVPFGGGFSTTTVTPPLPSPLLYRPYAYPED